MNFSLTYTGVIITILGFVFQAAGLPFDAGSATGAINFIVSLIGVITTLIGRYRLGGINIFGVKKSNSI